MKFTESSHNATYTRFFSIADGPVHPTAYSPTGKVFRVQRVKVTYTLDTESGRWEAKNSSAVDLGGTVLKKDGSDSLNDHSRWPQYDYKTHAFTPEYAWVSELIEAARPIGEVRLPEVS